MSEDRTTGRDVPEQLSQAITRWKTKADDRALVHGWIENWI